MTLILIDWIIIIVYLAGCMVAGLAMRRYVRGVEDFAVAGREMNVNLGIASLAATEMGLVTIMYTAQLGFEKGLAGSSIGVLMAIAFYMVGRTGFIIEPLRTAGVMTIPELFEKRFNRRVRWLTGLFVVLSGLLNMGIFLRLGGEFLVWCTGMPPSWLEWVMTALLGLVLIYTALGGMLSVLVTDYLQFLVMGVGIVVTSILVLINVGGFDLISSLRKQLGQVWPPSA
uniref:sodium:solute symporter family transporter n=1 Tax=Cephaloticoccus sp. TaxID=1985742 RepID=UPI00404A061A